MKLFELIAAIFVSTAIFAGREENVLLKEKVNDFVKGGDERNIKLLEEVLHQDFRLYAFVGDANEPWVMTREAYLGALKAGKIGGKSRALDIVSLKQDGNLAYVILHMKSSEMTFAVNQQWIKTASGWKLLQDLANAQLVTIK